MEVKLKMVINNKLGNSVLLFILFLKGMLIYFYSHIESFFFLVNSTLVATMLIKDDQL